jgi:hypothetical protein
MDELRKFITDAKKAVARILIVLEHNELEIPVVLDLEQAIDIFKYMIGYVDCLEKCGVKLKDE